MSTIGEMIVSIGANSNDFDRVIRRVQRNIGNLGRQMEELGNKMTAGITAPLAGIGLAAGKFAADSGAATGKIKAQLGVTADEAEKLGSIAQEVWKKGFGENLDETATSLTTVKKNMKDVEDTDLAGLTQSAYTLQKAFGTDINQSTKTAGTLMKNFGIDGQKAFDLITVGFQKGGDYSGELLDTMNEYAPQFKSMGMNADEMLGILISGAKNGAFNLDKVGDAVKEFNVRAVDGSKTTAEGFAAIGLDANKMGEAIAGGGEKAKQAFNATIAGLAAMTDPLAQQQAGVNLFGTQWEDVRGKVILAMSGATTELGKIDGATKAAGAAMQDNFGTKLTQLWRDAQSSLQPLGDTLLKLANEWMPKVSAAVEKVTTWFSNLSPKTQDMIVKVALIAAALGPLLLVLGTVTSAVANLIPIIKGVGTAMSFLAANPVGLIITAIAALIAIGILVWKNWDTISAKAKEIWEPIAAFFGKLWDDIKSGLTVAWHAIKEFFGVVWDGITWIFENLTLPGILMSHWDEISATIKSVWGKIKSFFSTAWKWISDKASSIFGGIQSALSDIWNGITGTVESVWGGIVGVIKGAIDKIKGWINNLIGAWNSISFHIPKIKIPSVSIPEVDIPGIGKVGGQTIGGGSIGGQNISVPQIPMLAKGGIVNSPTLAMIGEAGPEAVVPLSKMNGVGGGPVTIIVEMDGRQIAKGTAPHLTNIIRLKTGMNI